MVKQLKFLSWFACGVARHVSNAAVRHAAARSLADKFEEFVRRLRRAGLLFVVVVAALLTLSLVSHPMGLLLWLIALPLAGLGSMLSMLWPTRRYSKRNSADPASVGIGSARAWLVRVRGEVPLATRAAFDLVIERVKRSETLVGGADDLILNEARRLIHQHLPRLIQSFLALPAEDRTAARTDDFSQGLIAVSAELDIINERLLTSRTDRFEIERRFIANRYPHDGLASA